MSEQQFVLIHDVGNFGPFDTREAAAEYGSALCVDPQIVYGFEVWPITPPVADRFGDWEDT